MKMSMHARLSGVVFAALFGFSVMQVSAAPGAEEARLEREPSDISSHGSGRIEGVWDVRVTIRDCDSGAAIASARVMNMFIQGGTLSETGAPPVPLLRGPGLGTWHHLGGRRYSAVFRLFVLNADGTFAGTHTITRSIALNRDADRFTADAVNEMFDVNDNLIQAVCATETATRLD
jgi:hypothetical protein